MPGTGALGSFEEMVLLAILQTGEEAYAVSIRRELAERSGSDVAMGSVYATLDRLEEKGLAGSELEPAGEGRVGRRRRYYRVLHGGLSALAETRAIRDAMWQGLSVAPAEGGS